MGELKACVTSAELAQSPLDTNFKPRLLKEMLSEYKNYMFFEFATPVVQEFGRLNSLFQQTKADSHELYLQIFLHQKSLQNRMYDAKRQEKKNIHQVDFGVNFLTACNKFDVHGSVHRKYVPNCNQQDASLHTLFISVNCSTCFGWYLNPSSGTHTTVSTASGTCQTVTATCRYHGRVGTAFIQLKNMIKYIMYLTFRGPCILSIF